MGKLAHDGGTEHPMFELKCNDANGLITASQTSEEHGLLSCFN